MQRKRGTEFFDNSISVYLIVVFILVFGIMSCAKKESGTNDESYYTEERYYNSETEDVILEDQKKYSMKRYVGTESTLRDAPECFGLDNFLYNYNEIAKYGLDKSKVEDIQSHKVEKVGYARLTNYLLAENCYLTGTDSSLCGYEVMVFISFYSETGEVELSVQKQIIRDCIHAIDRKVADKWINYEIDQIVNNGSTIAYFNELFAFEGELKTDNTISFVIRYNPISSIPKNSWGYSDYKIPDYK